VTPEIRCDPIDRVMARVRAFAAIALLVAAPGIDHGTGQGGVGTAVTTAIGLLTLNALTAGGWLSRVLGRARLAASTVVADAALVTAAVLASGGPPTAPLLLLLVLPVVGAGLRYRVLGAIVVWFATASIVTLALAVGDTPSDETTAFVRTAPLVLVVSIPAGYLSDRVEREVERVRRVGRFAERRADALAGLLAAEDRLATAESRADGLVDAAVRLGATGARMFVRASADGAWTRTAAAGEHERHDDTDLLRRAGRTPLHAVRATTERGDGSWFDTVACASDREPAASVLVVDVEGDADEIVVEGVEFLMSRMAVHDRRDTADADRSTG
jgi:hypothetical protein